MPDNRPGAGGYASAYSTGGGGVVLEHAYGGALLAELLLKGPVAGLGDDVTPVRVGFQQSAYSPVDDLTVTGEGPGGRRSLFIGVRRKPSIGASQEAFVKLMVDYLRVVSEHRSELEAGSRRLGLAVEAPHTPADEIAALAYFVRRQPEAGLFRAAVHAPRATTAKVRARLGNVDDVVAAAVKMMEEDGIALACRDAGEDLSWLLLKHLHVLDLRLEGDDAAGRTGLVARLVPLAGVAAAADDLRRRLCELSAGYAVGSAVIDEEMLRRDLSGAVWVSASPAYRASWDVLESLEESLKSRTRRFLAAGRPGAAAGAGQLAVDRADIHAGLVEAMGAAGQDTGLLVVHGEPGAGKSAAVLAAVEEIRRAGGAVVALSLRDLPPGPPAATAQLLKAPTATYSASARASLRRAWPAVIIAVLDAVDAGAQGFTDPHWGEYAIAEMIPSPSPVSGDTDPDAIIRAARNGWPTASELNGLIERMLPHAVGYWRAADSLIGLLRTMPLADQANVGLPWVHKIVTNRRVPGMGTWLAVEWLRSLSEANAVDNAVQPLYDALVDTLAAEDYRGAVQL